MNGSLTALLAHQAIAMCQIALVFKHNDCALFDGWIIISGEALSGPLNQPVGSSLVFDAPPRSILSCLVAHHASFNLAARCLCVTASIGEVGSGPSAAVRNASIFVLPLK